MIRLTRTSKLSLITGGIIIFYSLINKFFLLDKNFKENFKNSNTEFHSSDLFLLIGILFLFFAGLYLLANKKFKIHLSEKLAMIHYVLTTIFVGLLMFIPIIDTITNGGQISDNYPTLFYVIMVATLIGILLLVVSNIILIINITMLIGKIFKQIVIKK